MLIVLFFSVSIVVSFLSFFFSYRQGRKQASLVLVDLQGREREDLDYDDYYTSLLLFPATKSTKDSQTYTCKSLVNVFLFSQTTKDLEKRPKRQRQENEQVKIVFIFILFNEI